MNDSVKTESLTDWKNEPELEDLKNDLKQAMTSHDYQVSRIRHWKDLLEVKGSAAPPKLKGRSSVQPKTIRKHAEWRYSVLSEPFLSSHKIFQVFPRTYEDTEAARQNELVLNWQFDTVIDKVKFIDDVVHTVVNEGTCIIRTGWEQKIQKETRERTVYEYLPGSAQLAEVIQQLALFREENPNGFESEVPDHLKESLRQFETTFKVVESVPAGTEEYTEETITVNRPVASIMNTANVYIDPTCEGNLSNAMFVIVSFETSLAELYEDGKYTNLDLINPEDYRSTSDIYHSSGSMDENFKFKDKARKKVIAYEYWGYYDINDDNTLKPIVATWVNDVMIRMEENPYPDGSLPFVVIPYSPVVGSVYGEPDAELLEDSQRIIGALTRGLIDLVGRSANSQHGIAKGMLDAVNERRFKNGEDYQFNPGFHPQTSYVEHSYPEVPQSVLAMIQLQNQEAESISGIKAFAGGISGETFGTGTTGTRMAIDAAAKREMSILRRLAKGISEVGMKFMAMNSVFLSDEEVIRVTNKQFVKISRESLKGKFDLTVDISTAAMDAQSAQDLGFILQTMGPGLPQTEKQELMAEFVSKMKMPKLAESIRNYEPQPTPMDNLLLQEQELKNQKIQSEVSLNMARANNYEVEASERTVGIQNDVSGISHMRSLEKQQAQARANQDLEVTKALVRSRKPDTTPPDIDAAIGYNQIIQSR